VFDEAARADFLRGFHKRKVERRTYGLAQQALKDRRSKLETRRERKIAQLEEIERSEQQKQELLRAAMENDNESPEPPEKVDDTPEQHDEDEKSHDSSYEDEEKPITHVEMYRDEHEQWGGDVIVTTSTKIPGDEDDSDPGKASTKKRPKHDTEQEYAGSLQKYMHKIKANLPRKRANHHSKRKGQHGASKSVGADFKTAQKALNIAKSAIHKKKKGKR
jgi:ribosomal RNA-processing protein 17